MGRKKLEIANCDIKLGRKQKEALRLYRAGGRDAFFCIDNQEFDAYVFVCNLIRRAKKRIVLVDRYVDEKVLAMMLKRGEGVSVTIYTYDKSKKRC